MIACAAARDGDRDNDWDQEAHDSTRGSSTAGQRNSCRWVPFVNCVTMVEQFRSESWPKTR